MWPARADSNKKHMDSFADEIFRNLKPGVSVHFNRMKGPSRSWFFPVLSGLGEGWNRSIHPAYDNHDRRFSKEEFGRFQQAIFCDREIERALPLPPDYLNFAFLWDQNPLNWRM